MAIAFLATIAAQMGSAWINSSRNKAHSEKMAELQRAYEEKAAIEGIENARAEFAELCSFQREMEKTTHQDRLELIKKNHENALYQLLREKSLHKWPLLVPPYVIANTPLTLGTSTDQKIPLNCILTTSSNLKFNRHVFPMIEEQIAIFCSKYWNISANKSIRFFQEAWKDNASDIGSLHKEIFAHLKNVPTLLISPILKNDTVLFRFYWWGLSLDPSDAHINELNELNPELSISITTDTKFDSEISNLIVKECVPKLEAFISFFADMYYWNFYNVAPTLPILLNTNTIYLPYNELCQYKNQYTNWLTENTSDDFSTQSPNKLAEFIFSVSKLTDKQAINDCISKYLNNKRSSGVLNSYYLSALSTILAADKLSDRTLAEINSAISDILNNEEIGYFPCAGQNDLFQTILSQNKYIPDVSYAIICPIERDCSIIQFINSNDEIVVGPTGYRTFIATHPEFEIRKKMRFTFSNFEVGSYSKSVPSLDDLHISKEDVNTLIKSQKIFINELSVSYSKLKDEFWNCSLSLVEISYNTISSIVNQIYTDGISPDTCLVIVGYSNKLDNYTISIVLMQNNKYVGDRFVCRSNSLDKTIRNKLNNKTILKIHLK